MELHGHDEQDSHPQPSEQKTTPSAAEDRRNPFLELLRRGEISQRSNEPTQLIFSYYRFTLFEEIARRKAMKLNF